MTMTVETNAMTNQSSFAVEEWLEILLRISTNHNETLVGDEAE